MCDPNLEQWLLIHVCMLNILSVKPWLEVVCAPADASFVLGAAGEYAAGKYSLQTLPSIDPPHAKPT